MDQSGIYVAKEGTSCAVQEDLPNSSELHLKSPEEWNREVQQFLNRCQHAVPLKWQRPGPTRRLIIRRSPKIPESESRCCSQALRKAFGLYWARFWFMRESQFRCHGMLAKEKHTHIIYKETKMCWSFLYPSHPSRSSPLSTKNHPPKKLCGPYT